MLKNISMSIGCKTHLLKSLADDKGSALLSFARGEELHDRVFTITSFDEGLGVAISHDQRIAIQFVVEDLTRIVPLVSSAN